MGARKALTAIVVLSALAGSASGNDPKWFTTDIKEIGMSFSTPWRPKTEIEPDKDGQRLHCYSCENRKGSFYVMWMPITSDDHFYVHYMLESEDGRRTMAQDVRSHPRFLPGKSPRILSSDADIKDGLPFVRVSFQSEGSGIGEERLYWTPRCGIAVCSITPKGARPLDRQRFFDTMRLPKGSDPSGG